MLRSLFFPDTMTNVDPETDGINTFREKSLHVALKAWYAREGDRFEVSIDGYVIDILRNDLLIEIQTRNFASLKRKLETLLQHHRVRLVYPVPAERWIVKIATEGSIELSRRRSPKRGKVLDVFTELVYMPRLIMHPGFALEVLLVRDEEIRLDDGRGSWRRKGWSIHDRRLLEVIESVIFTGRQDFRALLPDDLPSQFTTGELAARLRVRKSLAGKLVYTLKQLEILIPAGKRGRAPLYTVSS
jgi:hypothetical protein